MNDVPLVQELSRLDKLPQIALCLQLCQSLPPLKELIERLVVAELDDNIDVICVFEGPLKLHAVLAAFP